MGLDMYAYIGQKGQRDEYWENYDFEKDSSTVTKPIEIAYWRKHPNLHGWMEQLWIAKRNAEGNPVVEDSEWGSSFNGIELELTLEDLDELEKCVLKGSLPHTTGFFFGNGADDVYKETDLEFIKRARAELFCGLKVFYNSSW